MSAKSPETGRAAADKRQLILSAAIKVFAKTGYHGSRVSDIAREAGIAYGLVYHYFKNKEEILDTIFEEQWGAFLEAIEDIAQQDSSTEDKLRAIAGLILNAHRLRGDWVKVLVFDIQRSPRFSNPEQVRAMSHLFRIVARILREGQARGELRADLDPDVACFVFIGGIDIVVTGRVVSVIRPDGDGERQADYYRNVARTVVDIFLQGVGSGTEAPRGADASARDPAARSSGGEQSGHRVPEGGESE